MEIIGAESRAPPGIGSIPMNAGASIRNVLLLILMDLIRSFINPEISNAPPISGMIPTETASNKIEVSVIVLINILITSIIGRLNKPRVSAPVVSPSHKFLRAIVIIKIKAAKKLIQTRVIY